jgi:hypothetical protein
MNECQYTGQSVFESGGGIAIRRGFVGRMNFILLQKNWFVFDLFMIIQFKILLYQIA